MCITNECCLSKEKKKKLSNASYKLHMVPDHPIHEKHCKVRSQYGNKIQVAKKAHWADFLEHMSNIWMANCNISGDANNSGKTRIPTLMLAPPTGSNAIAEEAASNEDYQRIRVPC